MPLRRPEFGEACAVGRISTEIPGGGTEPEEPGLGVNWDDQAVAWESWTVNWGN